MQKIDTLGELKKSSWGIAGMQNRTVKDEMRANLIRKLEKREALFPGIIGYDDSVIPQLVNAILSKHHMILLGLRGQAKSRILRSLADFLDDEIPVMAGCEISDNPFSPLCRSCRLALEEQGDEAPIDFLGRADRYVEKLATPDVTIADIIGDVDPIRAARRGLHLSDELTIHYGLLPRSNRGIFAINELPDLAGKVQVGLFNILQEGDVQIKGYPLRLLLDVVIVFTANPEDYTARGKIITPLKDRIGSEIRTHYPASVEEGLVITEQQAWLDRFAKEKLIIPDYIKEVVELIAFRAREDKKIDKRSGVSQRLPISVLETVVSNAERRAILNQEKLVVPRVSDVYAAIPSITGKIELEYEGEIKGADKVALELIKEAVAGAFSQHFHSDDFQQIVNWFDLGGTLRLSDTASSEQCHQQLRMIQGLFEKASVLGVKKKDELTLLVSASEFILDGLYALRKINRNEEKGYLAAEKPRSQVLYDELPNRPKRTYN